MRTDDPTITFPPELPVSQLREEIAEAIRDNQVVIVAGETGSGKTTQLPKIALSLGRTRIGHTQPRRIAARTIAERIAEELGDELGGRVGYQVRFTDQSSANTQIKVMTDGILLNEIHRDRELSAYDTIIIDEAHERSLNIDFLLGYLKTLLPRRPDLKLIITSATIDPESFSKHFSGAPIIEVSGRTFPVDVRYRPLVEEIDDEAETKAPSSGQGARPKAPGKQQEPVERDLFDAIGDALDELSRESAGDVLVFLSGESEIRDAADAIEGRIRSHRLPQGTEVLPLYGRLSSAEQHRVFESKRAPGTTRRIVLATNVAETSLTVPGIRYVIDAGTARISRYSARSKVQRLPIEAISQASANQRSGRSGRTSPGIAIRLYSEEDFLKRPEFTEPEVLRTGLASVILQMISLGLGDIEKFPFLTPPDSRGIKDGLDLLSELGAIKGKGAGPQSGDSARTEKTQTAGGGQATGNLALTKIGRDLARLPIEPRFARMVIESKRHGVSREVLAIVAGLTIQDVRERPTEKRELADAQHKRFVDQTSDFLTLLNLWNYLEEKRAELSSSAFRRLCKAEYLNFLRVREWGDLFRQLKQAARPLKLDVGEPTIDPDGIHRSLLSGLLSHLGVQDTRKSGPATTSKDAGRDSRGKRTSAEYLGSRNAKFVIFPGSALAKKPPHALMAVEFVETSRLFARSNAAIDTAWAEELAGPLVKRSIGEPHWEKKQGAAVAYERVTLFGVPLVERRRVQYARFDEAHARELFIRHALVEGEWDSPQAFDKANRRLRHELEQLEERSRRRDILLGDEAVYQFYDERVPADVVSTRSFEGWWRKTRRDSPELLTMRREDLLEDDEAPEVSEHEFPKQWRQGDQTLSLSYRFEPGAEDDGVTVTVPLPLLPRVDGGDFQRLVPGLRKDLVTALIKSLPKAIRRNVVPAADWAQRLLERIGETEANGEGSGGSLTEQLAAEIRRATSVPVTAADFDLDRIPDHLRPSFRVVDHRGRTVAQGKDLSELQSVHAEKSRESIAHVVGAKGKQTKHSQAGAVAAASAPPHKIEQTGATAWSFGTLERYVESKHGGGMVRAYPAIVDTISAVDVRLVTTPEEQAIVSRRGLRRLLVLSTPSPVSYLKEHLNQNEKLLLSAGPYRGITAVMDDVCLAVADSVLAEYAETDGLIWTEQRFAEARDAFSSRLIDASYRAVATVAAVLGAVRDANRSIERNTAITLLPALTDARDQLGALVFDGFISRTGLDQLPRLTVYAQAVTARIEKLAENPGRDRVWMTEVQNLTEKYRSAGGQLPPAEDAPEALTRVRWMLEELRVSLFAQHLKTAGPVSAQRITKALGELA
ncbi:ATP-dependent RNA helicase HrpA [Lysinibacter cavernae]|uniref:ATP-dependent helicase HrpA n=1 Tax=Lysinibacter cavernae TaxID=1640652 RepID=A0A7X5TUY7_9MICO|nr:ATP-dependent RNA helicase HrpA [Lysinibacter cavernae]NIH54983.1 ATP-dependent helicase HrpA [Lysinibacter cavernae]